MLEDRILLTAIPNYDPGPPLACILKNRLRRYAKTCNLFLCIQEDESGPLTVKMKDGLIV